MVTYETNRMHVSHEIKSQLAKLLATEDLVVEHRQIETAQFNVHTRVLTLPIWDTSNTVYDMLVGHEVGHALFTPDEDWFLEHDIPPQFVNVVEDARIEKMMKRKYPGLAKTFFGGYKEMSEKDFFDLQNEDVSSMNLADRVNLYFKIGNFIDIKFDDQKEMSLVRTIAECETFEDVLIAAESLYKYCKEKIDQEDKSKMDIPPQESAESGSPQQSSETLDSQDSESDDSENESQDTIENNSKVTTGYDGEPEVTTADNLEEKLKDLVDQRGGDNVYAEIPKLDPQNLIAKNSDVHGVIDDWFTLIQKNSNQKAKSHGIDEIELYSIVDQLFYDFKKSAQKEVNYLVKEFECKKAADSYARASTSRTGVLDTTKLHTYKYNEDLFKKVTVLPDGKNHGLIFVLDWSGSMSHVLQDTCKQLFNLIWFCKKVSIPFEVYAFTNEWKRAYYDHNTDKYVNADRTPSYDRKEGFLAIDDSFSMMNIFTSQVPAKEIEKQMINIWRIACYYGNAYGSRYSVPDRLSLSGTPLNEALVSLHTILPDFQKTNKLQKVQCIVLTDGEANSLSCHVTVKRPWEPEPFLGTRHLYPGESYIRDRKLGTTYAIKNQYRSFTDTMLRNLKDNFPNANFIGIRVLAPRDAKSFIRSYCDFGDDEFDRIQRDWTKLRSFTIKSSGYDAYFGMSSTTLSQDSEFDVDEGATKAKIKSAFFKSLKTKKLNKKVLGEFISLVV